MRTQSIGWIVVVTCGIFGAAVSAQEKPIAPPAAVAEGPAPQLTEVERLKLELLQVRTSYAQLLANYDACKAEVGTAFNTLGRLRAEAATAELTAEEAKLKAAIEAGHPGYRWDPKTGTFTKKPPDPEKK